MLRLAAVLGAAFLLADVACAEPAKFYDMLFNVPCMKTEMAISDLTDRFKAKPISQGVRPSGELVQLWSDGKGWFTILMINPNGVSCALAGGTDWGNDVTSMTKDKGI